MKATVEALKKSHSERNVCRILGCSRSHVRDERSTSKDDALLVHVRSCHRSSGGAYGAPRIHEELREQGIRVAKKRIARVMQEARIYGQKPRKFVPTTDSNHDDPIAENLLDRNFNPSAPNTVWVGDITYLRTGTKWSYLSVLIDLYSRRVVGWYLSSSLETEGPLTALTSAIRERRPPKGLLVHHDRGCQYASHAYREELKKVGAVLSMSRKGNCWDNAPSESFFATLKRELGETFISPEAARAALSRYFEWYNAARRHSHNIGLSPINKEIAQCMQRVA